MTEPELKHFVAAVIGLHRQGAKPDEIARLLNVTLAFVEFVILKIDTKIR